MSASVAWLIDGNPSTESEDVLAAHLPAMLHAAMELHCRAMPVNQAFEGRSEALGQAGKSSRIHAAPWRL